MNPNLTARPSGSVLTLGRVRAIWCMALFSLLCCDRRLAVLDPPVQNSNAGSGGSAGDQLDAGNGASAPSGSGLDAGPLRDASANHPEPPPIPPVACNCASSDALLALGCGVAAGAGGTPTMSDDGQTLVYIQCNGTNCKFIRWHDGVLQEIPASTAATSISGLSSDGDQVLLSPAVSFGASATVYRASDGSTVATGLRPTPVVMGGDGSIVGLTTTGSGSVQLARWTRAGGLQELGALPFDANLVELESTPSQDVVVGASRTANGNNPPFRWTQAGGVELDLPGLQAVAPGSSFALSRDGSTLAGYLPGADGFNQLVFWTPSGGAVTVGAQPSTSNDVPAVLLSGDGSVLAGALYQTAGGPDAGSPDAGQPCVNPDDPCLADFHAFRWTQQAGSVVLIPGVRSEASLMSADGSVIVGTVTDGAPTPFYWNAQHGARSIAAALDGAGVDLSGWQIGGEQGPIQTTGVRAMSADGRIIVGEASCGGAFSIFRAVLPD